MVLFTRCLAILPKSVPKIFIKKKKLSQRQTKKEQPSVFYYEFRQFTAQCLKDLVCLALLHVHLHISSMMTAAINLNSSNARISFRFAIFKLKFNSSNVAADYQAMFMPNSSSKRPSQFHSLP